MESLIRIIICFLFSAPLNSLALMRVETYDIENGNKFYNLTERNQAQFSFKAIDWSCQVFHYNVKDSIALSPDGERLIHEARKEWVSVTCNTSGGEKFQNRYTCIWNRVTGKLLTEKSYTFDLIKEFNSIFKNKGAFGFVTIKVECRD